MLAAAATVAALVVAFIAGAVRNSFASNLCFHAYIYARGIVDVRTLLVGNVPYDVFVIVVYFIFAFVVDDFNKCI